MIYSNKIKYIKICFFMILTFLIFILIFILNVNRNEKFVNYEQLEETILNIKKNRKFQKVDVKIIINNIETIINDDIVYYYLDSSNQNKLVDLNFKIYDNDSLNYIICDKTYQKEKKLFIDFNKNTNIIFYNDKYYFEYELDFTNIPIINLKSNKDLNSDNYINGNIDIYDDDIFEDKVEIKLHGGTSRGYKKKSYKIKLKHSSNILDLNTGDEFILDASYSDPSLIRNKLSVDIWNLIQKERSYYQKDYKSNFVILFINNDYNGLYIIKEPVDRDSLKIDKNGIIIKGIRYTTTNYDADLISNTNSIYGGWELKYPKNVENYDYYWKLFVEGLGIYYNNIATVTDNILYDIFDIENIIDYRILLNFTQAVDNFSIKNTYLSIQNINNKNNKWIYTPWDLDQTYGRIWDDNGELQINNYFENYVSLNKNLIFNENSPKYNQEFKKRYLFLRKDILNIKNIYALIDSYYTELALGEYSNNSQKWNEYNLEDEIEYIKLWIKNRLEVLDKYIGDYNA